MNPFIRRSIVLLLVPALVADSSIAACAPAPKRQSALLARNGLFQCQALANVAPFETNPPSKTGPVHARQAVRPQEESRQGPDPKNYKNPFDWMTRAPWENIEIVLDRQNVAKDVLMKIRGMGPVVTEDQFVRHMAIAAQFDYYRIGNVMKALIYAGILDRVVMSHLSPQEVTAACFLRILRETPRGNSMGIRLPAFCRFAGMKPQEAADVLYSLISNGYVGNSGGYYSLLPKGAWLLNAEARNDQGRTLSREPMTQTELVLPARPSIVSHQVSDPKASDGRIIKGDKGQALVETTILLAVLAVLATLATIGVVIFTPWGRHLQTSAWHILLSWRSILGVAAFSGLIATVIPGGSRELPKVKTDPLRNPNRGSREIVANIDKSKIVEFTPQGNVGMFIAPLAEAYREALDEAFGFGAGEGTYFVAGTRKGEELIPTMIGWRPTGPQKSPGPQRQAVIVPTNSFRSDPWYLTDRKAVEDQLGHKVFPSWPFEFGGLVLLWTGGVQEPQIKITYGLRQAVKGKKPPPTKSGDPAALTERLKDEQGSDVIEYSFIWLALALVTLATISAVITLRVLDPMPLVHFAVMTRRDWLLGGLALATLGGFSWRRWDNNYRPEQAKRTLDNGEPAGTITEFSDGKTLRLSDSRALGFWDKGAAENTPGLIRLILLPGGMESRLLDYLDMDETLVQAKVRVYIIEPPEDGLSSPHPSSVLADWVADVDEFATRVFQGQDFWIGGHSAGGFVARCYAMATKVSGLKGLLMADSPGPMHTPIDWCSYPFGWVLAFLAAKFAGPYALKVMEKLRKKFFPWEAYRQEMINSSETPESDKEVLRDDRISEMFRKSRQEAFRQGPQGIIEQIRTVTGPLPTQTNDWSKYIVLLFHGEEDPVVPIQVARDFAKLLPNVVAFFFPRMGHHWIRKYFTYVIAKVVEVHNGIRPKYTPLETMVGSVGPDAVKEWPMHRPEEWHLKHAA